MPGILGKTTAVLLLIVSASVGALSAGCVKRLDCDKVKVQQLRQLLCPKLEKFWNDCEKDLEQCENDVVDCDVERERCLLGR